MRPTAVFDFDGVVADTFELTYGLELERNPELTREQFMLKHTGNYYETADMADVSPATIEYFETRYQELIADKRIDPYFFMQMASLAETHDLYIVSSAGERILDTFLTNNDMHDLFVAVLGRETHQSKVVKLQMLAREYGVDVENSAFVTDTTGDIQEAQTVGMPVIGVSWGYHPPEWLEAELPDVMVHSTDQLIAALQQANSEFSTE